MLDAAKQESGNHEVFDLNAGFCICYDHWGKCVRCLDSLWYDWECEFEVSGCEVDTYVCMFDTL